MDDTVEPVVGIDLGTTNSEIAAFVDGKAQIIGHGDRLMLPSCVGLSPTGELLIGDAARNQLLLYPDRTVRSVKRLMGSNEPIKLADKTFSPPEISALILRELAAWAGARLGRPVKNAVVTVPAYFSDAQRNATREAGQLAGLDVVRMINEPTAASLAYGLDSPGAKTVLIYDLGGGTLDVSVVRIDGEVTEVLASHGNNHLGGDDFDQKLVEHLLDLFRRQHGIDLRDRQPAAFARLWWAAEAAKQRLSSEPYATVREEALLVIDGRPLNLEAEIARRDYEAMIRPLLERTLDSAARAMADARLTPSGIDDVLLVGGSTRTPLVQEMLEALFHKAPRHDLHPDLCVALGAGVLASRIAGHDVQRLLVDVSPYSFGISYLGERGGFDYPYCYKPVIKRNTPLPVTRTEEFFTAHDFQTEVEIDVYQGDDPDALRNTHVGKFRVDGLKEVAGPNPVLCRMRLDLDGVLHVTAIEKRTGLSKHVRISGATRPRDEHDIRRGREELDRLFAARLPHQPADADADADAATSRHDEPSSDFPGDPARAADGPAPAGAATASARSTAATATTDARALIERCRAALDAMHAEDREEALNLIEAVVSAEQAADADALAEATRAMNEFLFFIEGR